MKNRNNVFTAILVVLAFAIAPVLQGGQHLEGGPDDLGSSASPTNPRDAQMPVITVHSTDNVTRGRIGSFVAGHETCTHVRWNVRELQGERHRYRWS